MKAGSGHKTPTPTMEASVAAMVSAVFNVGWNRSLTSSTFLTSSFGLWALPASSYGGLGLGHKS